jgi:hypothetical protein
MPPYIFAEMFETSKRYLVSKNNNFVKENRELFWNIQGGEKKECKNEIFKIN